MMPFHLFSLHVNDYPLGYLYDKWFDFIPDKKVKQGGRVRMKIHIANRKDVAFVELL